MKIHHDLESKIVRVEIVPKTVKGLVDSVNVALPIEIEAPPPAFFGTSTRTYLEKPLTMLNGDTLRTHEDGTVEQIRDGEVIDRTRWTTKILPVHPNFS